MFYATTFKRVLFFIGFDLFITAFAVYMAFSLRFDFAIDQQYYTDLFSMIAMLISFKISFFYFSSIYKISWRHFSFQDSILVIFYSFLTTVLFVISVYIFRDSLFLGFPRSVIPIEFFISLALILGLRISKRYYLELFNKSALGEPTLVIAKEYQAAEITRKARESELFWVVALFDGENNGVKINGVEFKDYEGLQHFHLGLRIAIVSDQFNLDQIFAMVQKLGIDEIKIYNSHGGIEENFKSISVEDLLARHPKDLDKKKIASFIKDETLLITGAGGSIGSEIVRQCVKFQAKKIILLDHSEYNLYKIDQEIENFNTVKVLQSVVNKNDLEKTFIKYKPTIVIHAAAYKHVPLVEENISETIKNNIIGTKNIIDIAIESYVKKVVLISTDKAVRPTNVMGATKRVCELYAQNVISLKTEIVAVRFGNVLGSSGSVIPKFKQQIKNNQNITVTHPDITRYFMLIPEACELVLQAGAIGKGGEIFILDMGTPIKIVDLAQKMIDLSGKKNIEIVFTGLRAGEKLYEELLLDESESSTPYPSIMVSKATHYDIEKLQNDIVQLLQAQDQISELQKIVPEFTHKAR